jgi:biotin carboxylase
MRERTIAVVDPFFSGANFLPTIRRMGHRAIGIRSSDQMPGPIEGLEDVEWLTFAGDPEPLLSACRARQVDALFAGSENGVLLADRLSETLNLPTTNGTAMSLARRHKGAMKDAFLAAGVPCARYRNITNASGAEVLDRMREIGVSFPVILKPAMGYGTIGVRLCENPDKLARELETLRTMDMASYDIESRDLLLEEYLEGEEIVVDTMADHGDVAAIALWQYEKVNFHGTRMYKYTRLLDPEGSESRTIVPVALAAVRALGIRFGPCHVEMMVTPRGPKILEVGARMAGGHHSDLTRATTGIDVERATVEAFLGLRPRFDREQRRPKRWGLIAVLMTDREGEIVEILGMDEIRSLPSFQAEYMRARVGCRSTVTRDLMTLPGMIHLTHENPAQLERDGEACLRLFDLKVR